MDPLPGHLVYGGAGVVPAGGTFNWDASSKTLVWSWTSLAPGTYLLTYQAAVDLAVTSGTVITNCAGLTYSGLASSKSACVSTTMASLYTVHVGVYNEAGELVKEISVLQMSEEIDSFSVFDSPTITSVHGSVYIEVKGEKIATWDGTNQAGDPVSNGKYYLKVDNVDGFGTVTSVSQSVLVNRSIARVQVDIFNEAGEIVRHLYSYADDPGGGTLENLQLSSSVLNPSASTNGSVNITASNGMTLVWNGKSDSGSVVSNGRYEIEIHVTDGKGGEQVVSRGIVVESQNQSLTNGNVIAEPNILKGGRTTTTLVVESNTPFTLVVQLYDVAGEKLGAPQPGKTGSNRAEVSLSGLSSGLYFAVVNLINAEGGSAGKQTARIVLLR